jgi:molybdopterin-guanine dinucleotide biosynthesis protein A
MSSSMFDVEGFILVGGQSSRMGTDKSRLSFGKQTAVERIAGALGPLTTRVRLVGSRNRAAAVDLESIPDSYPGWGALGGIHSALSACHSEWAVIVACDLPLVSQQLFLRLWQLLTRDPETFDAVVPIQPDERPQPLCAIYRRSSCSKAADKLIAEGEHKPRVLLANVRTRRVEFHELADLPGAEHLFLNMNTPKDYEQAVNALGLLAKPTG